MSKKIVLIVFIIISVRTFAQREVYFNASKPEDLKVESLKGVELQIGFNPFKIFSSNNFYNPTSFYTGFFTEKRIASSMTLGYSGGLFGSILKTPVFTYDSISGGYISEFYPSTNYERVYNLGLRVGLEPRWYWNFKKRAEQNNVRLNSGWFLSMPLNYEYLMYSSFKLDYPANYTYQSYGYLTLKPTIGYRQSITKNIFLEGSFGYGIGLSLSTQNGYFQSFISDTEPELKLKAAYTFK